MHIFTDAQTLNIALNDFLEARDIVYFKGKFYDCELVCVHVEERRLHFGITFHLRTDIKVIVIKHAFAKDRHDTEISKWFASNGFIFPS